MSDLQTQRQAAIARVTRARLEAQAIDQEIQSVYGERLETVGNEIRAALGELADIETQIPLVDRMREQWEQVQAVEVAVDEGLASPTTLANVCLQFYKQIENARHALGTMKAEDRDPVIEFITSIGDSLMKILGGLDER